MKFDDYKKYISEKTMMGPNCVRVIGELLERHPLALKPEDKVLDLGCGRGLTSLVIAKETGAKVYANDLWVKAEDNKELFEEWGVGNQITPSCEDANDIRFDKKSFSALFSIDSYHYFAGERGYFQEKILPFIKDEGVVLIGIPGIKDKYADRSIELLTKWLGDEAFMFKSPSMWKEIIGEHERIKEVETWELDCFEKAWLEWLDCDNEYAKGDKLHWESIIKPYSCFVGIYIKLY